MTIEKNLNGTELNVKVSGRLDTTTAPELEASLKESFEGLTKLVLDFSELEPVFCRTSRAPSGTENYE